MRQVALRGSERTLPVIGQGTWGAGVSRQARSREVEALRLGISLGMTLIDTAEYYACGGAEEVVGEAIADCRDQVFVVTKVWPSHAGYEQASAAVHGSLGRLGVERLDAVLLHWPTHPGLVGGTLRALAELQAAGAIGHVGVSNFDLHWLRVAARHGPPEVRLDLNQVRYALPDRRIEHAILPFAQTHDQVLMAYTPLGHGRLHSWRGYPALSALAAQRGVTPHQIALAFLVAQPRVVAIPKAVSAEHIRANAAAGDIELTADEIAALENAFPRGPVRPLLVLPQVTALFRLIWWVERMQHGRR